MRAPGALSPPRSVAPILGASEATSRLRADIARAARFSSSVLITGPSGAGKELVARWLHELSCRSDRPFVPVDCASLAGELMASQLFGHVAGAFTGANCDAMGCFRAADGGTIFLDEIGEMEFPLQAKFLRVLQERVVTPVGSVAGKPVDVRVVAATNRDLRAEVRAGRFREDLYYRLRVVHLRTTPLAERRGDVTVLATAFLAQLAAEGLPHCKLAPAAAEVLTSYDWPGNVRELRNLLEQAVIGAEGPWLTAGMLAELIEDDSRRDRVAEFSGCVESGDFPLCSEAPAPARSSSLGWQPLAAVEREYLVRTLEHTFYNRAAAARLLGVTRQTLLRKMERHDIRVPRD